MKKIPAGYLSVAQTALFFSISPARVRRWAKKGLLPFIRFEDYRILFEESQIMHLKSIVNRLLGRET